MKVSVAIVTYNHERFIAKALDSVLSQRTAFEFEVVLGEDCSSDTTRDIVMEYKRRYPDNIRLLLNEKNLGMHANGAQVLRACTGEYIAMLDGDDYWTSAEKLQKQVDFLSGHPECSACFHDALIIHEDNSEEPKHYRTMQKEFSTVEDLLIDNFIPTAAVMFRRTLIKRLPAWAESLEMGDWVIHILNALHGRIGYIDEVMSVYVVHGCGVWSTKSRLIHTRAIIELFEALDRHLDSTYLRDTKRILRWRYYDASGQYEQSGDLTNARLCAVKAFMKHLVLTGEQLFHDKKCEPVVMPHYITSVRGAALLKNILRLYLVPVLRTHLPSPLYKRIGAIARKLNAAVQT